MTITSRTAEVRGVAAGTRRSGPLRLVTGLGSRIWLAALLVAVWQLATQRTPSPFFPPPSLIVQRLHEVWFSGPPGRLFLSEVATANMLPSLARLFAGWSIAALLGVVAGVVLGRASALAGYVDPMIHFFRAIPPPALIPFFLVLFKLGTQMQIATIVFGVIWPILLNAIDGARYADRLQIETAKVFGVSRVERLWRIILPAAAPKIFAGLRVSLSLALILMVISELVGSTSGIGYQLLTAQRNFDVPGMWSAILLLGILGYLLNAAFLLVERRLLGWHHRSRRT